MCSFWIILSEKAALVSELNKHDYYRTQAVSSPRSDPGKEVVGLSFVLCPKPPSKHESFLASLSSEVSVISYFKQYNKKLFVQPMAIKQPAKNRKARSQYRGKIAQIARTKTGSKIGRGGPRFVESGPRLCENLHSMSPSGAIFDMVA